MLKAQSERTTACSVKCMIVTWLMILRLTWGEINIIVEWDTYLFIITLLVRPFKSRLFSPG